MNKTITLWSNIEDMPVSQQIDVVRHEMRCMTNLELQRFCDSVAFKIWVQLNLKTIFQTWELLHE